MQIRRRRVPTAATAALAALLTLGGCASSPEPSAGAPLAKATVTGGSEAEAPKVALGATPLKVSQTTTRVIDEGEGAVVRGTEVVSLRYVLINGTDGSQLDTNFGKDKPSLGLNLDSADLLPGLKKGLAEQKVGSRVLIAMPPKDAFGEQGNPNLKLGADDTVVFLMDILSAQTPLASATGRAVSPPPGLPTVRVTQGKPATISVPKGAKPPTDTVGQLLIEGQGAPVTAGQRIRVTYTGALWKDGSVFDSSANAPQGYFETVIGQKQVINAWDTELVGQKVGSRVLLVVPPKDGYGAAGSPPKISGTDTLVFVVDILAAY